jgi:EAL domain-containing protein (putative c-di-GMP-specific phosphodiesterase class I)
VAEETGIIDDIGRRVLFDACAQLCEWKRRLPHHHALSVSINLSPRELVDPDLRIHVAEAVAATSLDPSSLILEITEGAMMRDADSTVTNLRSLKDLGVRLAVDDFGTGYSSLTYLQRFPVDILKIDRFFVSGAAEATERGLVPAIVRLAETMQLLAVAEGVETAAQADAVRAAGCQLAQGYFYAPPQPVAAVTDLLASNGTRLAS